jgi:hypothetical protein
MDAGRPKWWWVQFPLGVYLLLCGMAALYFVIDTWSNQFSVFQYIFPRTEIEDLDTGLLKTLLCTIAGSVIGAVIISFQGLHEHGAVRGTFEASYIGSYLIGPWAAALLGVAVYGLIRSGLFILGGVSEIDSPNEATQFGYLGIGTLIGFAWNKVLLKLSGVADEILGTRGGSSPQPTPLSSHPEPVDDNRSSREDEEKDSNIRSRDRSRDLSNHDTS